MKLHSALGTREVGQHPSFLPNDDHLKHWAFGAIGQQMPELSWGVLVNENDAMGHVYQVHGFKPQGTRRSCRQDGAVFH
jgi:hypothetical protein